MSETTSRLAELVKLASETPGATADRVKAVLAEVGDADRDALLNELRTALDTVGDDADAVEALADVHEALTTAPAPAPDATAEPAAIGADIDASGGGCCGGGSGSTTDSSDTDAGATNTPSASCESGTCGDADADTDTETSEDLTEQGKELVTATARTGTAAPTTFNGGAELLFRARAADAEKSQISSPEHLGQTVRSRLQTLHRSGSYGQTESLLTFSDPRGNTVPNLAEDAVFEQMEAMARVAIEHERHRMHAAKLAARADNAIEFADPNKPHMGSCCAEPVPLYEFCQVAPVTGILDLPSITVGCGGLKIPVPPTVTLDLGCWQTTDKDEDPGARSKPCATVGCATWRTIEPCLTPLCVEIDIMMRRGFPGLATYAIAEALRLYEKFHNRLTIKAIRDVAQKIDMSTTVNAAYGVANNVVQGALIAASQLRHKRGVADDFPIRLVGPSLLRDAAVADLALRCGNNALAWLTDTLSRANISVTWVRDMESIDGVDPASGWGGPPPYKNAWPTKMWFLLFPPDAFYLARDEIVRVTGLRQTPDLIRENKELALFVEHSRAIVDRCPEAIEVTVNTCPSGYCATGTITVDSATICGNTPPTPAP